MMKMAYRISAWITIRRRRSNRIAKQLISKQAANITVGGLKTQRTKSTTDDKHITAWMGENEIMGSIDGRATGGAA
jgi:hypothetical protein